MITRYKLFETRLLFNKDKKSKVMMSGDIAYMKSIMDKKDDIEREYDLRIKSRTDLKLPSIIPYIDIYRKHRHESNSWFPVGVYNVISEQFILFYDGFKSLNKEDRIIIESNNFFNGLEKVYYHLYSD